jgi:hypothetical protein
VIQVHLNDGDVRMLHDAVVKLTWTDADGNEAVFDLRDVTRMEFVGPEIRVADGQMRGMPIRGVVVIDDSAGYDVRFDVPMPKEYAREMGERLQAGTKIEIAKSGQMPVRMDIPRGK